MSIYRMEGAFDLPDGKAMFDALNDGRLIVSDGAQVLVETQVGSRHFSNLGTIQTGTPDLLRVSPGGTKVALGSYQNQRIFVFPVANVHALTSFEADNFDAEWVDEHLLAISAGSFPGSDGPVVTVLDTMKGTHRVLVQNIGSGSGGVTVDRSGNLYVGNGYDATTPQATGTIKAYGRSSWREALSQGRVMDFATEGTEVADLLSAAYLGFDRFRNLHVGGGDYSIPNGIHAAVARARAIAAALGGGPPVTGDAPPDVLQRLDPDPAHNTSWFTVSNRATGELYLKDFDNPKVYVFVRSRPAPQPRAAPPPETLQMTDCHFHLGDNEGAFPGARFVGHELRVDIELPDRGSPPRQRFVRLETAFMETLGVSRHRVLLNDTLLGVLSDDTHTHDEEQFEFPVPAGVPSGPSKLTLRCEELAGGFSDDFLVRRYGTRLG